MNRNLDVMVTFAPLADCEERNLPLIESSQETREEDKPKPPV